MMGEPSELQPVVYVIDDDSSIRGALSNLIRSVGLQAEVFASTSDFLKTKRPDGPCCLVLDVRLPGASGLDFQAELTKSNNDIPIIFITGHGDIPMTVKAMKAGAIEFLTKPFRDQDLLDAIQVAHRASPLHARGRQGHLGIEGEVRHPDAARAGGHGLGDRGTSQQASGRGAWN